MTRRFELTDGKSNKFWEVDRDGAELHLRWGRIGTAGQSKTKDFPSEEKAEAEQAKLVKKKTSKGYSEVSSPEPAVEAASEPPPPPAEVEPEPEPSPEPAPESSPAPVHGAPPAPFTPFVADSRKMPLSYQPASPAKEWKRCLKEAREHLEEAKAALASGTLSAQDAAWTREAVELLSGAEPAGFDPHQMGRATFLASNLGAYWGARGGPREVLAMADAAQAYQRDYGRHQKSYLAWITTAGQGRGYHDTDHLWGTARQAVGAASAEDRASALDLARGILETASLETACRVVWLFPEEQDLILDITNKVLASPKVPFTAGRILGLVHDATLAGQLVDVLAESDDALSGAVGNADRLLDNVGLEALGPMLRLWDKGGYYKVSVAKALTRLVCPEVATFFVGLMDTRDYKKTAREYLEGAPQFAIPALARSSKILAQGLLAVLIRKHPEVLAQLRPGLDAVALRAIEREEAKGGTDLPEAAAEELPPVLVDPPWRRSTKAKAPKAVVLDLEPLDHDEVIHWRRGQRQSWRTAGDWVPQPKKGGNKKALAALSSSTAALAKGKPPRLSLYEILGAEDEVLATVWSQATGKHWDWITSDGVKQTMGRLGEAGITGLLAFGERSNAAAAELLGRVETARAAPIMARAMAGSAKGQRAARTWLEAFPEAATKGLIPVALSKDKKGREGAELALAHLEAKGHGEVARAVAARYGDAADRAIETVLGMDPLDRIPKKAGKLPPFFDAAGLPRPLLAGRERALPLAAVEDLAIMLSFSPVDPPYPGIDQVKERCDEQSLFDFAWELFSAWVGSDGKGKTDWAMMSLAHFGDDEAARRLTPMIRLWPGQSQHGRATRGLDVLAAIGSDVALMHLHGISQKLKFKALKAKALEKVEQIAEARGLSAEELADRLVPDLDLDQGGSTTLDFGPRSFTVGFDEHLKPFVLDGAGKRLKSLPKAGKKDDAARAKEATARFKALKKDVRATAAGQITRLELAMCGGRRWRSDVYEPFFIEHPLMLHLVRRLVWATFSETGGALARTFRVAEDRSLADVDDEPFVIPEGHLIGLPHPLELGPTLAEQWGVVFADYEILQPFAQLGREIYEVTDEERSSAALTRVKGRTVKTGKIRGLEARGWRKGPPQDAGGIYVMEKPIPGATHQAELTFSPGIFAGDAAFDEPEQELEEVSLQKIGTWGSKDRLALGEVTPVVFSELVRDLELAIMSS